MKAIETQYKGYRFRSRLEARWAVFFDRLGIKWDYELEGFELPDGTRYLPDFRLHLGMTGIWFEVKGRPPIEAELRKCQQLADASGMPAILAWGTMAAPTVRMVGGKSIVEGAPIVQMLPDSFRPGVPAEGKAVMAGMGLALISGFYEDHEGAFAVDFLYADDLPIVQRQEQRPCVRVSLLGEMIPGANVGFGRLYRSPRLLAAYNAARGARFEFGESGGPGG